MLSRPPSRMLPAMASLRDDFLRYVSQTSPEPMGLEVARSHGCVVVDTSGKEYLDLLSGIGVTGIGHTHPAVVQAVQTQAERYLHAMVYGEYIQKPQVDLARRLAELAPGELSVTYFTNSGTEAVEGALKTARKYTGRSGFVSFVGSFHGDTFGSVSVGAIQSIETPLNPCCRPRRFFRLMIARPCTKSTRQPQQSLSNQSRAKGASVFRTTIMYRQYANAAPRSAPCLFLMK